MKIITWNCNMAFRKKSGAILSYLPDILVIQECEHISKITFNDEFLKPSDALWFGENTNKGLAIFTFNGFTLRLRKTHNPALKMIIPVSVTRGDIKFNLFAIWANNPTDPEGAYVEQVWKAIHHYDKGLNLKNTILTGDFNSNTIWDRKYRKGNHSHVVEKLEVKGIFSCYHLMHGQQQGREAHPTFHLYKHADKPYHLDYCFVSADMKAALESVEVGTHEFWKKYSDHVPLIVSFKDQ